MIFLESIELEKFKGIEKLTCDFDDLTLLAGLNNAGKTTVLQAIYLSTSALPTLADHPSLTSGDIQSRAIDLNTAIGRLGLPGFDWLLQGVQTPFRIRTQFWNDIVVTIEMVGRGRFCFTCSTMREPSDFDVIKTRLRQIAPITSELFRPPGLLAPREIMLNGDQYRNNVAAGQGNLYWRNSIWWGIQTSGGPETFELVRRRVEQHFPNVKLFQPTLAAEGQPAIMIRYEEPGKSPLDISQSGAGLHTFLALSQLIEQSGASIVLLDEPDSHLHASQQRFVLDVLQNVSEVDNRQVIIATHSPEMISRVASESIRWLEPGVAQARGGVDTAILLDRLGASANVYLSPTDFPDIIVYVEGDDDKPFLEALISWCRRRSNAVLPTTKVVRHKDGKYSAVALQAISRTVRELSITSRVVGIRDLDWDYRECDAIPPPSEPCKKEGPGYFLLTLPCKELENLLCDPMVLHSAVGGRIPHGKLQEILESESLSADIKNELKWQAEPQIRGRLESKFEVHSRERIAEEEFEEWFANPTVRIRLVSGKSLFRRVRARIKNEVSLSISLRRVFETLEYLPASWLWMAQAIFPDFSQVEKVK